MMELNWALAGLLLVVVILSGASTCRPREVLVTWDEFARQCHITRSRR